jgi:hypothetical protein
MVLPRGLLFLLPSLPPVQFWLPGYPAYKLNHTRYTRASETDPLEADEDRPRRHREYHASSTSSASSASHLLLPLPPPVFLALGARCACIPYTSAFQGTDICVVRPLSARETQCVTSSAFWFGSERGLWAPRQAARRKRGDVEFELRRVLSVIYV